MTKHSDVPYIQHMLEAIEDIEESIGDLSKEEFVANKDARDANIRRLEIIGEAVKNLSKEFREKNSEIEWNKIAGTRDKVIHNYFGVNLAIVWEIIKKDLPELKKKLKKIV
ncbi:MAG: DUF86 domain-containing protein [Nanoarchaeota archaeon]